MIAADPRDACSQMLDTSLLTELRDVAQRRLGTLWTRMLERADDALFDLSQQGSGSEEAGYFEAMRELRRQRAQVEALLRQRVSDGFAALQHPLRPVADRAQPTTDGQPTLSLVDADALEGQLAVEHLAAAVAQRHRPALTRVNLGLGQVLSGRELDDAANPLAPLHLATALRDALVPMTESVPARLVVLKWMERVLLADYGTLLDELLRLMAARGIKVELPPTQRATDDAAIAEAPSAEITPLPLPPARPAAVSAASADAAGDGGDVQDELFVAMRDMFAAYLARRPGPFDVGVDAHGEPTAPLHRLDTRIAIDMLTTLQQEPTPPLMRAVDDQQLELGGLLQQLIIDRAVESGRVPAPARLDVNDEHALTLLGMLFDLMLDRGKFVREIRSRFISLMIPYAKVALADQRLFAIKTHPARKLLNSLTEACDGNRGEVPADRELLARVAAVIDRILKDATLPSELFVDLEQRFHDYHDQHRRRSALAERRAAEMQRGRERLEDARQDASLELASLVGDHPAPKPIADFLRRDWTHHLTITSLRVGMDSDAYRAARTAGVSLWLAFLGCEDGRELPDGFGTSLLPVLQSGGQVGEAAEAVIAQLRAALEQTKGRALCGRAVPLAAGSAHGFEFVSASADYEDAPPPPPGDGDLHLAADPRAARREDIDRVRELKVGDWIEIVDADGRSQPAKLSWISPISSRLLFVNRRGMRLCVLSPDEMAALVASGKLSIREVGTAFEQALTQMIGRLKSEAMPQSAAA